MSTTQGKAVRIGTLTGRAIGVFLLLATSISWFVLALNPTVYGLAVALMLTTLAVIALVSATVIHKWLL